MKTSILMFALPLLTAAIAGIGCRTGPEDTGQEPVPATASATQQPEQPGAPQTAPSETAPPQEPARPEPQGPEGEVTFLPQAFPPIMPDTEWHQDAWMRNDCLRCHETGVGEAPVVKHEGMPEILLVAKCRSCHVLVPGAKPRERAPTTTGEFAPDAFPPMMPASESHRDAWLRDDCLLCHENGIKGAPKIVHKGMPDILLTAKCRTCHPQVRAVDASEEAR